MVPQNGWETDANQGDISDYVASGKTENQKFLDWLVGVEVSILLPHQEETGPSQSHAMTPGWLKASLCENPLHFNQL